MDRHDLPDHHPRIRRLAVDIPELLYLRHPAFQNSQGFADERRVHHPPVDGGKAGKGEFVDVISDRRRRRIHPVHQVAADEIGGEDAGFLDIAQAVLPAAGREHDQLRPVRDRVEEGIGREVHGTVPALRANPADRPRRDDGLERIMRQAVLVGVRGVEHQTSPTQVTTSASSGRGRSTGGNVVEPMWI
ncbi:hypothetical protein D3C72_1666000 [compost metagenome]